MIIGTIYKGQEKEFLNFFRKIRLNRKAVKFIKERLNELDSKQIVFLNIYGIDDKKRIKDLEENERFEKVGNAAISWKLGLGRQKKDAIIHIHFPGLNAGAGYTNWWEYKI